MISSSHLGWRLARQHRHRKMLVAADTESATLVGDLGAGGGLVSASVYDTAQVVRFAPPPAGSEPAVRWLTGQQAPDGGWGSPAQPLSRHISTLAAMLALAGSDGGADICDAVARGEEFMRDSSAWWRDAAPDDLSVGAELIMRRLLRDAEVADVRADPEPYQWALRHTDAKLAVIAGATWAAGSAPLYVWDAWGCVPDPAQQSPAGDVGTSPSATARWLAGGIDGIAAARARDYLDRAAAATGARVPGVVPFVFPIERMEQIFSLYGLSLVADRLAPAVRTAFDAQVDDLETVYRARGGASHTDVFELDGDDTGVAACVLAASGRPVDPRTVRCFERDDHFRTYEFEFQSSVTTTAHCLHALALLGESCSPALRFLLDRRSREGLWEADKWHTSWCYVTSQCLIALAAVGAHDELAGSVQATCARQHPDGGFGAKARSTDIETAFVVLALAGVEQHAGLSDAAREAAAAAAGYLQRRYDPAAGLRSAPLLWTAKEQYSLGRLDRSWLLAALAVSP
jgi:hypothetical protein